MKNCGRNNSIIMGAFLLCLLGVSTPQASAEQTRDPLIEVLIRKGILTEQEAMEIRAEAKALEEDRQKHVVEQIEKKVAPMPKGLKDVSVGMRAYVDYSNGQRPLSGDREESYNEFRLNRGYLTVKNSLRHGWGSGSRRIFIRTAREIGSCASSTCTANSRRAILAFLPM